MTETVKIPDAVNGFPVIARRPRSEREFLMVCDRGARIYDRYVAWRVYIRPEDGSVVAYSGYYTSDLGKALRNIEER